MIKHPVQWTTMPPLWPETAAATAENVRATFNRPAILRFASDDFMDQFLGVLEKDPRQLSGFVARHETWRKPAPTPAAGLFEPKAAESTLARKLGRLRIAVDRPVTTGSQQTSTQQPELKLYQPGHQRYYLVTASLVCGISGLPDKAVDPGREEKVGFLIRRMFPPGGMNSVNPNAALPTFDANTWEEHAFVVSPKGKGWQKADSAKLMPGEEQLPLFAVNYAEDDGRRRRLFSGLVPVGKREAYMAAGKFTSSQTGPSPVGELPKTARKIVFRKQVAEPWKALIRQAFGVRNRPGATAEADLVRQTREQIQTGSWYVLAEFAEFLTQYLPEILAASSANSLTKTEHTNLFNALLNTTIGTTMINALKAAPYSATDANFPTNTLLAALKNANLDAIKKNLAEVNRTYDRTSLDSKWPTLLFPLADPVLNTPEVISSVMNVSSLAEADEVNSESSMLEGATADMEAALKAVDSIVALVVRALPKDWTDPVAPLPLAAQSVVDMRDGWFVIRCVFEQPACGPLHQPVLSDPTEAFQMAGFFDPDAPARPIRIALPLDTTPEGLRKFDKNTAFMISDVLCGQIQRFKGITLGDLVLSVLPAPFHKSLNVSDPGPCNNGPNLQLGMMCSLSIPIVTICALILMMIIVSLLDFIFRWIPYLIMCFPLPGLKAKKS